MDDHEKDIADPYHWLEDLANPQTRAWVGQQNCETQTYMQTHTSFQQIQQDLRERWNYPKESLPEKYGQRYFFTANAGLQQQAALFLREHLESEPHLLLDPNILSQDGTVALLTTAVNPDGTLLVYGLAEQGSDWQCLHIRRIDEGQDYPEVLTRTRFSSIAWNPDSRGFYYTRYPEPGIVVPEDERCFQRVYYHRLGTPQTADTLIFERPDAKTLRFFPLMTEDGVYLLLQIKKGTEPQNRWYYRRSENNGPFLPLLDEADAAYRFVGNKGATFFFSTTLDAPRGRVISIDLAMPKREKWREIIPQQADPMDFVRMTSKHLVVVFLRHVRHVMALYTHSGHLQREIPWPLGAISQMVTKTSDSEWFLSFSSCLSPTTAYRYEDTTETLSVYRQSTSSFEASPYLMEQVFYLSSDGTRIPMCLVHRKGITLNGTHALLLHGYGGFGISQMPAFSSVVRYWLEHGGIYAIANVRGGGEYGEEWHHAGMLDRKQQVFDDFIAAAEWLIAQKYTSPSRLAISGGSNGGLLVSACMVQRPALFGAVLCQVPVADMLRYHRWHFGNAWETEYGNAEKNADHFRFLLAYSPLHNVKAGVAYPPALITTAEADDRVAPAHALKLAATLQAATSGTSPLLLYVQPKAGHGMGKPTAKAIELWSLSFAFLFHLFHIPSNKPTGRLVAQNRSGKNDGEPETE